MPRITAFGLVSACRPKRSGRKRRAEQIQEPSPGGTATRTAAWQTAITILQVLTAWATPTRWAATRRAPAHMARWIWQATSGNGSATGIQAIIIRTLLIQIHKVRQVALEGAARWKLELRLEQLCARRPPPNNPANHYKYIGFRWRVLFNTLMGVYEQLLTRRSPDRARSMTICLPFRKFFLAGVHDLICKPCLSVVGARHPKAHISEFVAQIRDASPLPVIIAA